MKNDKRWRWRPSRMLELEQERADWKRWAERAEKRFARAEDRLARSERLNELAWGLISNSYSGHWSLASKEWERTAERWSDDYHNYLQGSWDERTT